MKIDGMKEFQRAIERMKTEFPRQTGQFMRRQALKVEREAKKLTPVDTGTLKSSWGFVNSGKGRGFYEQTVYNLSEYSAHIEFGHRVKAKGNFTDKVVLGRYMLKKAVEQVESEFEGEFKALVKKVMK